MKDLIVSKFRSECYCFDVAYSYFHYSDVFTVWGKKIIIKEYVNHSRYLSKSLWFWNDIISYISIEKLFDNYYGSNIIFLCGCRIQTIKFFTSFNVLLRRKIIYLYFLDVKHGIQSKLVSIFRKNIIAWNFLFQHFIVFAFMAWLLHD